MQSQIGRAESSERHAARPDVLYCIEHVARELNIACAVRTLARERYDLHVHVHVLSQDLDPVFDRQEPRLITVPYCSSRKFVPRDIVQRFPDVPIVNLACEQLLSRANRPYRMPKDDFAREQVTHAAAGDFFRRWLWEVGVPLDHVALVGSTTCQLYREPYRQFFERRRETLAAAHGLNPNLPWILLPENFGAAFFTRAQARKRRRGGYARKQLREYMDYARRSFRDISRWCVAAASRGRVELIVRPRPAIAGAVFAEAFWKASEGGPQPHLHFIKEGSIQEWILASQVVVSSYSTTLLEAAVAGRPAYLLEPRCVPESAASQWHQFAPRIRQPEEFAALVDNIQNAVVANSLVQWANDNLLDGGDAIENVARLLAETCGGTRNVPVRRPPSRAYRVDQSVRQGLKTTERWFRQLLRPRRRPVFGHECDVISRQSIDERTEQWAELLRDAHQGRAA